MSLRAASLVACLVVVLAKASTEQQQCVSPKVSSFRVSMRNLKNSTGHWTTQVAFKQAQERCDEWSADIDQNVLTCEGQESTLETVINLQAPPRGSSTLGTCPHWFSDVVTRPKPPATEREGPIGYELFPGVGYYKFHPEKLVWPLARKVCTAEGGHLIILNSQEEVDVAVQIYTRHPNAGIWFLSGILEMGIHAEWFTMFGVPLEKSGFSRIYPGENNAPGPSDFGAMHRTGDYADVQLTAGYPFICEFEL